MSFEDYFPEGYASNERLRKFNDRDDRAVKLAVFDVSSKMAVDSQATQESYRAEAYRVNADGSLIYPGKPKQTQPGYYTQTAGVIKQSIADDSLARGNAIGDLMSQVAERANAIAVTLVSFNLPSE